MGMMRRRMKRTMMDMRIEGDQRKQISMRRNMFIKQDIHLHSIQAAAAAHQNIQELILKIMNVIDDEEEKERTERGIIIITIIEIAQRMAIDIQRMAEIIIGHQELISHRIEPIDLNRM